MASYRWQCDKCGALYDTEKAANACASKCSEAGPECSCKAPRWGAPNGTPICLGCSKPMPRAKERIDPERY